MIEQQNEPDCNRTHDWFCLGVEDNGEIVHRCNNCMALRYDDAEGTVLRYQVPER